MLESVVIALIVFFASFGLAMVVLPKILKSGETEHTRHALRRIMEETKHLQNEFNTETVFRSDLQESGVLNAIMKMPGGYSLASYMLKAGYGQKALQFLLFMFGLLGVLLLIIHRMDAGIVGYLVAILLAYFLPLKYLERRVNKRNDQFIDMFPDVLDMIVRSVRSGFPLNTAIQMVAENMEPPVSTEFKQVADEIALGRTMDEALSRLAERVDEPDINFFVVVLNVQQETGGNLAEVIGNLSTIIRKRKQLRQKIKAMTSEGRATGWVLGSLPLALAMVLNFMTPDHLTPLFDTFEGNILLIIAVGLLGLTFWIIRQMLDIDI